MDLILVIVIVLSTLFLIYGYRIQKTIRTRLLVWPLSPVPRTPLEYSEIETSFDNPYAAPKSLTEDAPTRFMTRMTNDAISLNYLELGDYQMMKLKKDKSTGEYVPTPTPKLIFRFLVSPDHRHLLQIASGFLGSRTVKAAALQTLLSNGQSRQTHISLRRVVDPSGLTRFQFADEMNFSSLLKFHEDFVSQDPTQVKPYSMEDPVADLARYAQAIFDRKSQNGDAVFTNADQSQARYTLKGTLRIIGLGYRDLLKTERLRAYQKPRWLKWVFRLSIYGSLFSPFLTTGLLLLNLSPQANSWILVVCMGIFVFSLLTLIFAISANSHLREKHNRLND